MGLSRQGAPRNCWALLGPSRRAKVLAEPGPEADLVAAEPPPPLKVPRRRAKSRLSGSNRLGVEHVIFNVEDSHKAERHLLVVVKQYDREFQKPGYQHPGEHRPPPTHPPPPPPTNLMATV